MSMAVQLPHPIKSAIEDDSAHICQPHIKNITQSAFFHLENISRLQLCISDGVAEGLSYASTSDLEHCCWILPGSSSKTKNSAARVLIRSLQHISPNRHHHSLAPSQVLQTPPTKVTILLLIIPQISLNYTPHPAWFSRIKGNDRKWADSTRSIRATLSVCWLLFILHLCIYEVFSSFQSWFNGFQRWDAPQQPPSRRFKWFVYFKAAVVRLHL